MLPGKSGSLAGVLSVFSKKIRMSQTSFEIIYSSRKEKPPGGQAGTLPAAQTEGGGGREKAMLLERS